MNKLILVLTMTVLAVSVQSKADLLLEPYVGYEAGTLKTTPIGTSDDMSGKTTMINLGARIGFRIPGGFWIAGDAAIGTSGTYVINDASAMATVGDGKTKRTAYGLATGFDFPMGFRLYAGYDFANNWTTDHSKISTLNIATKGGTSYKLGLGYKFVPKFALNIEYYMYQPKTGDFNSGGILNSGDISTAYSKWEESGYRFVASFPLM